MNIAGPISMDITLNTTSFMCNLSSRLIIFNFKNGIASMIRISAIDNAKIKWRDTLRFCCSNVDFNTNPFINISESFIN